MHAACTRQVLGNVKLFSKAVLYCLFQTCMHGETSIDELAQSYHAEYRIDMIAQQCVYTGLCLP